MFPTETIPETTKHWAEKIQFQIYTKSLTITTYILFTHHTSQASEKKKSKKSNPVISISVLLLWFVSTAVIVSENREEEKKIIYLCAIICFFPHLTEYGFWFFVLLTRWKLASLNLFTRRVQVIYINGDLLGNYNDNPSNHQVQPISSIRFIKKNCAV